MAGELYLRTDIPGSPDYGRAGVSQSGAAGNLGPRSRSGSMDRFKTGPTDRIGIHSGSNEESNLSGTRKTREKTEAADHTRTQFKRDRENGKMYMHVIDEGTGEVIQRIPKEYLETGPKAAPQVDELV